MDDGLKQRLIGAVILVCAGIIFIPILFDDARQRPEDILVKIPERPDVPKLEFSRPQPPSQSRQPQPVPDQEANKDSVAVEETTQIPLGWTVQLASFKELANAESLRDKLRKSGYKSYIKYRPDKTPPLIQVFVGPELKRVAIDALQTKLESQYELEGIVVRYDP